MEMDLQGRVLVFCNVTNEICKRTDTAVAFTQVNSRVSYPLRNVSTLSMGSSSSKDTHAGVEKTEERIFLYLESMPRRRDHIAVILRAKGIDRLIQADSSKMMLYPISEHGGLLKGSNRAVTTCRLPLQTVGLSDN